MTWGLPVSRERYDERCMELATARAELAAERERYQDLYNWIVWRVGGGVAPSTSRLPEAYQPKTSVTPTPVKDEATKLIHGKRAPGQARIDLAEFEVNAEQNFQRFTIGERTVRGSKIEAVPNQATGD